jgi:hypothetical protein
LAVIRNAACLQCIRQANETHHNHHQHNANHNPKAVLCHYANKHQQPTSNNQQPTNNNALDEGSNRNSNFSQSETASESSTLHVLCFSSFPSSPLHLHHPALVIMNHHQLLSLSVLVALLLSGVVVGQTQKQAVYLQYSNVPSKVVVARLTDLLSQTAQLTIVPTDQPIDFSSLPTATVVLGVGNTFTTQTVMNATQPAYANGSLIASMQPESFFVNSIYLAPNQGAPQSTQQPQRNAIQWC